ncbi:MAG: prepilin peptidase [Thermodesulfobacteriota bacterium]
MELNLSSSTYLVVQIFSFILGAVLGSFLNVCIYRLPREESIAFPPSHCTSCNNPIKFYDNIPILSYLILGGKCRNCSMRISPIYPIIELISAVLTLLAVRQFGINMDTLFYIVLIYSLIIITFIDLEHMIIPNVITFPGIGVGIIFNLIITNWGYASDLLDTPDLKNFLRLISEVPIMSSILGVLIGGGLLYFIGFLYEVIRKREGMGMGDVKLLAMLGAFLGWQGVIFIVFLSSIIGTVIGLSIILYQRENLKYAIPFGPFLSIAAIIYIFTGGFSIEF